MALFDPITLRSITFKNRIAVSPMCMYSSLDGAPNEWHMVHLGSRAVGGAGLVIAEASAVVQEGRISPDDAGIYSDAHVDAWAPITQFIKNHGSVAGIQLAHAGRKASMHVGWKGGKAAPASEGGWSPVFGPSAIPFADDYLTPQALDANGINHVIKGFKKAAARALAAGFELIELHAAHGYLLHEFMSPLSNTRTDEYGGSLENRTRLTLEVAAALRTVWPDTLPLFVRISATDWAEGGWDLAQSIELAKMLKPLGVDLIDVSSGGNISNARMKIGPGYQVAFSEAIKREAGVLTGAVGLITEPAQADTIISTEQADLVLLARGTLRNPYWPMLAAQALGAEINPPKQYARAW